MNVIYNNINCQIWEVWLRNTCLSCILILILKTYFRKILSARFLRKTEILKKYYFHHFILKNKNEKKSYVIKNCGKRDISKNCLISDNTYTCKVTSKKCYINNDFDHNYMNDVYFIRWTNCNKQYVGSSVDFKNRFKIHKSDINTKKDRCGVARHFTNKSRDPQNLHVFLKIQPIKQVSAKEEKKLDDTLWHKEKYWQALLLTKSHGMNSITDLYNKKRKDYRKKWFTWYVVLTYYVISWDCEIILF